MQRVFSTSTIPLFSPKNDGLVACKTIQCGVYLFSKFQKKVSFEFINLFSINFYEKSRKALAEYSVNAFVAGTKALAERMGLRTCQEGTRRIFGERSSIAFLAGTKALAECSSIRRLPSYLPGRSRYTARGGTRRGGAALASRGQRPGPRCHPRSHTVGRQ